MVRHVSGRDRLDLRRADDGARPKRTSRDGTLLGAFFTFLLYGVLPLAIVLYLLGTPARRGARGQARGRPQRALDPDGGGHAAGDAVAPEREEP